MNSITVFVKVVQAGSFSEAARRLNMPKTTVSARVKALEVALGVTLIHRTTRQLKVTDSGRRYFKHCAAAIERLEAGRAELTLTSSQAQGDLRVTAPFDLGHTVLPHIVCQLLKTHPLLNVDMQITNRVVDLVGEGIDVALRAGPMKDSSLVCKRLFRLGGGLWASPHYLEAQGTPTTPKALKSHQLIAMKGMTLVRLRNGTRSAEVSLAGRVRCDDFSAIKAMTLAGAGMGLLPNFLITNEGASGTLLPVLPGWAAQSDAAVNFVYPGLKRASANVRAFIEAGISVVEAMQLDGKA